MDNLNRQYIDEVSINARTIWKIIFRNWLPILACILIFAAVGYGVSRSRRAISYSGTVNVVINMPYGPDQPDITKRSMASSLEALLQTPEYYKEENINLKSIKKSDLKDISINVKDEDNDRSLTHVLTIKYDNENRRKTNRMVKLIEKAAPTIAKNNLHMIESIDVAGHTIKTSVHSSTKKYTVAGAALGFVLSVGYILIQIFTNRCYRNSQQIEENLEIPVLGNIPTIDSKRR
ncbi:YveK family protein [Pseudoramibacter porci]|uniref:Polysaccharide chain length determinant N-terminal domain-containing protein n=1 Tax=Pseudoramibacter porci TaxID=2606631 RepID=A0A7X2T9I4_9FIRM|nr:hypothetical protein [Pseudoramibacter porci]MSS19584.1 hypothetical protein [Pseudoramibacter porci]